MSKIGYNPIKVEAGVSVIIDKSTVSIKGANGELNFVLPKGLSAKFESSQIFVDRYSEDRKVKALHGLYRSLLANAVVGVSKLWEKRLEVVGTGYSVKMQGSDLVFKVGFSHLVNFPVETGVTYRVEGNNKIIVSGVDKQLVGQVANKIRSLKKPDVYKGKGIRYEGEVIKLKPGKKAKA